MNLYNCKKGRTGTCEPKLQIIRTNVVDTPTSRTRWISKIFLLICSWQLSALGRRKKEKAIFRKAKVAKTNDKKANKLEEQKVYLPNMKTIRRSGSIFFTPLPISTTTFGLSTIVFLRLKSNLEPSFSSLSFAVLIPQPILPKKASGKSHISHKNLQPVSKAYNLISIAEQMTSTNKVRKTFLPPGQPRTISFYGNPFSRQFISVVKSILIKRKITYFLLQFKAKFL